MIKTDLTIIGGGFAGTEATWQAGQKGLNVRLLEKQPAKSTGAHQSPYLAELVCSNSFGFNLLDHASGLLKNELLIGSLLLQYATSTALPAGSALAVDRVSFSKQLKDLVDFLKNNPIDW